MAFILGAAIGLFIISSLVGLVAFRKTEQPKKHFFVSNCVGARNDYCGLWGGDPQFIVAAINYGIASIILLVIFIAAHLVRKKLTSQSSRTQHSCAAV